MLITMLGGGGDGTGDGDVGGDGEVGGGGNWLCSLLISSCFMFS